MSEHANEIDRLQKLVEQLTAERDLARGLNATLMAEVQPLREANGRLRGVVVSRVGLQIEEMEAARVVVCTKSDWDAINDENARLKDAIRRIVDTNTLREVSGWSCVVCQNHVEDRAYGGRDEALARLHWIHCPLPALADLLKGNQHRSPRPRERCPTCGVTEKHPTRKHGPNTPPACTDAFHSSGAMP